MMGDYGMGMGLGWIFWVVIIIGVVFLFRSGVLGCGMGHGRLTKGNTNDSLLNILKQRYAKGEISKDEFEQMKKEIL